MRPLRERLTSIIAMSPGPTFDRVYLALKEQLMSGRFAPGEHLEPVQIGEALHASITPVRDALHRLVGERLAEAPRNDGFRAPVVTELGLRQLYGWQVELVRLAIGRLRPAGARHDRAEAGGGFAGVAEIFVALGRAAGDFELLAALVSCRDRLAAISLLERQEIPDLDPELDAFSLAFFPFEPGALRVALLAYLRRRERAVPRIVEALQRPR